MLRVLYRTTQLFVLAVAAWLAGGSDGDVKHAAGEPMHEAAVGSSGWRVRPGRAEPRSGNRPGAHEFYFSRGIYSDAGGGFYGGGRWAIDYPKADRQFLIGLRRLTNIDAYDDEHAIALDDPELTRFPFLYILEVGFMALTDSELEGLREYLLRGGFLVVDDFWGTWQWLTFESEMRRVFPDRPIVDLGMEHPVFESFYNISEIRQVPNVGQGRMGGPTYEQDGYVPRVRGIFDDDGRLMVIINWNTDLGDAWEWADDPYYPLKFSTFAYQVGINFIIYAMSH